MDSGALFPTGAPQPSGNHAQDRTGRALPPLFLRFPAAWESPGPGGAATPARTSMCAVFSRFSPSFGHSQADLHGAHYPLLRRLRPL